MRLPVYLDYSATTPVDRRVAEKMIPFLTEHFGNAASRSHAFGWKAEEAVEEARAHVAALLNADPKEIVWTSGATEGNNLAIKGAANFYKTKGKHIITQKTEHKAVLDTFRELERQGFEATYLEVDANGLISLDQLKKAHSRGHHPGLHHDGEQRDWRSAAGVGNRRPVPLEGHHLPLRRGAGRRAPRNRRAEVQGRPAHHHRAQDLRPEGHRRALRAAQAAGAHRGADPRRRPRARLPLRHSGHAPDRRLRRSGAPGESRDGERERARAQRCATGC